MKEGVVALLVSCILLGGAMDIRAGDIAAMRKVTDSLCRAYAFDSAIVISQLTLREAEKQLAEEDTTIGAILFELGYLYQCKRDLVAAEPYAIRSLAIRRTLLGPDDLDVAMSLTLLSMIQMDQNRLSEALISCTEVLRIRRANPNATSREVAAAL